MKFNNKKGSFAPRAKRRRSFTVRKANRVPYGIEIPVTGFKGVR